MPLSLNRNAWPQNPWMLADVAYGVLKTVGQTFKESGRD